MTSPETEPIPSPPLPSLDWEQLRVMRYVFERRIDRYEDTGAAVDGEAEWLEALAPAHRRRAAYFASLGPCYAQLGTLPGEMRQSIEPLHPLPAAERDALLTQRLRAMGVDRPEAHAGLSLLSRALLNAYSRPVDRFDAVDAPADHPDLFVFDPLTGFLIWPDAGQVRNCWFGNLRDLVELQRQPALLKSVLLRSPSDHFSIGRSLWTRLVGPRVQGPWTIGQDDADIPTVVVDSQRDLEALAAAIVEACAKAPLLQVHAVFRGQNEEFRLPDREHLVRAMVTPYSDVRDHSVVPSMYRRYDTYADDPATFRRFALALVDWHYRSDRVFGDPAEYRTLDGRPTTPRAVPADSHATMQASFAGTAEVERAFADVGARTRWTIRDAAGTLLDEYVKVHRLGHDNVRRNLVLQHYGAPTPYVDVTRDIRVAEWFALHQFSVDGEGVARSQPLAGAAGGPCIFVFLVPEGMAPLVDTEALTRPEEALRPHRQACAVLGGAGNLYRNAVSRFIGLKIRFSPSFVPGGLPSAQHLFPGPDEDEMLRRLREAEAVPPPGDPALRFPVYGHVARTP